MDTECVFCKKFAKSQSDSPLPFSDIPLFESENFVVVPTIGAIVEGWLLVITKHHEICMGALPPLMVPELDHLSQVVCTALQDCYGSVAIFEHGPVEPKQQVGCTIDHAHLHIVPTSHDLRHGVQDLYSMPLEWKVVDGIGGASEYYDNKQPYLYLAQPVSHAYIATSPDIKSQSFRRVIASYEGHASEYNWREYPELHNVDATIAAIETWKKEHPIEILNSQKEL